MVWEYTDNAAAGTDTTKEAPKEIPVKKGQVCPLSFLILLSSFNSVISCRVYELMSSLFFLNYLNYFMDVLFSSLFSPFE